MGNDTKMNKEMPKTSEIQNVQLAVLKEFQSLCTKHKLDYFAIGGTCIGAVRHKGFIPWDDDIDVAMPFHDYQRLISIAKRELHHKYELIEGNTCEHFIFNFAKIHDVSTTCIEQSVVKYKDRYCGIFIDIFPIHNLPNSRWKRKVVINVNHVLNRMNMHVRFPMSDCQTAKRKLIHLIAAPFKLIGGYRFFSDMQNRLFAAYDKRQDCKYVIFPWRGRPVKNTLYSYKDVFFATDFSEIKIAEFEDTVIRIPNGFDRYLRMDFGDYMQLPPECKRKPGHSTAIISIGRAYKEYL